MIQVCRDTSDAVALYLPQRLYLKPFAKLNISVQLPPHKVHGKSISNWELMEKLRKMIQPDIFSTLKVSKHSSEVIRFDAELEQRDRLDRVLARLEDRVIQLTDYPDPLKVKVCEARLDFPTRHSWDSFFRDATDMDEMKPGERPDTVHISYLPIRWFVHDRDLTEDAPPSESIFKKAFEKYGSIRQVDVPAADPFRMQMKDLMRGISIPHSDSGLYFEGYIQFSEYVGFVRCMDALRGKKLLRKKEDLSEWCNIRVDFDKTKHMTDAAVKRRAIVRERLLSRQKAKDEEERLEKERIAKKEAKERQKETVSRIIFNSLRQKYEKAEREKLEKMREREERRKKKQLAKLMERDDVDLNSRVAEEQKKLLKAQKKLQAIRLIEELFKRIELRPELQRNGAKTERYYAAGERSARARVVDRYRRAQEQALEAQRERLRQALDGRIVIRSALETKKPARGRESSISSLSSEGSRGGARVKTEKLTTPEREREFNKATGAGMYGMAGPFPYPYPYHAVPPPGYPFGQYFPGARTYYPPPPEQGYGPRRARGRGRGRGRGPRMPYFEGPDATHLYYKYFKKLTEQEHRNEHDDRDRGRSKSRRRSYSRSRSRSRSRSGSRRRSYSRSRSRSRRSRSRRSHSRSRRSRSRRSRSHHTRSRTRSRSRRKSRSKSTGKRSRSRSKARAPENPIEGATPAIRRSKSWSLPKDKEDAARWSKSPKETTE